MPSTRPLSWNMVRACRVLGLPGVSSYPRQRFGVYRYGFWRSTRAGELRQHYWDERRCLETLMAAKRAYRVRAQILHPDHGGTAEAMIEATAAWQWLARRMIRRMAQIHRTEARA